MTSVANRTFGAQSMTAPLREVLVKAPGPAFGRAFDVAALRLPAATWTSISPAASTTAWSRSSSGLGVAVRVLDTEADDDPDLVYVFDPLLIADGGAIPLRPGKPNRAGEPVVLERWTLAAGIPTLGRIEAPGTVEGGDTFWLRPDLLCIGRTLRTNDAGARQLASIVGGDVRVFDVPYWKGPAELVHLLSVISPVADDVAVVFLPLLPAGLYALLADLGVRLVEVPEAEYPTLGCNVLAVRPGVVVVAEGNDGTRRGLEAAGCEVHAIPLGEVGENGSGGVTCLTRPILRG